MKDNFKNIEDYQFPEMGERERGQGSSSRGKGPRGENGWERGKEG
jgi:hypothetical protein